MAKPNLTETAMGFDLGLGDAAPALGAQPGLQDGGYQALPSVSRSPHKALSALAVPSPWRNW